MAKVEFSIAGLAKVDQGKVAAQFDELIRRAVDDVRDRPGDPTARKVSLTLEIARRARPDRGARDGGL